VIKSASKFVRKKEMLTRKIYVNSVKKSKKGIMEINPELIHAIASSKINFLYDGSVNSEE